MGRVYLGWHERLHRLCAIKIISPDLARFEPRLLQMFFAEARSAARLQHPNIVAIHSVGEDRSFPFIEMEYVDGLNLREVAELDPPCPPLKCARLGAQIASALSAAHARNLVHGDVKPDNVLVTHQSLAKLVDFGLARTLREEQRDQHSRTVGTPGFMAPELFVAGTPNVATDVYALGTTLFHLLTRQLPYSAATLSEFQQAHAHAPVPEIRPLRPDVPEKLESLIQALLAKEPENRPGDCLDIAWQLHEFANALVDLRELIADALRDREIDWSGEEDQFTFRVLLPDHRRQVIHAEVNDADTPSGKHRILTFWTPCAPATEAHYRTVLDLNGRLPYGAFSIRNIAGQPYFVMVENHPRDTIDAPEIRAAVLHLAEWADYLERQITGRDIH